MRILDTTAVCKGKRFGPVWGGRGAREHDWLGIIKASRRRRWRRSQGGQYLYLHPSRLFSSSSLLSLVPFGHQHNHEQLALPKGALSRCGVFPIMLFWLGVAIVALVVWKLLGDDR
jgi:hypothetical protein